MKDFDDKFEVSESNIKAYLADIKVPQDIIDTVLIGGRLTELLTQFINSKLSQNLEIINNKCSTCVKYDVCEIHKNVWTVLTDAKKEFRDIDLTLCVSKCSKYKRV